MKKLFFLLFMSTLFVYACNNSSDSTDGDATENGGDSNDSDNPVSDVFKRYGIESGIVEYKMSGSQTGTETLQFDNYGMREVKHTNTTMEVMGYKTETSTISLFDGEWHYSWDPKTKQGTKMSEKMLFEMAEKYKTKDFKEIGEKMMESMGAKKLANETFLGKDCEVWEVEMANTKTWNWNGVTLKTETSMMGITINSEATSIQDDVSIPEDKFAVPTDVTFTEVNMGSMGASN